MNHLQNGNENGGEAPMKRDHLAEELGIPEDVMKVLRGVRGKTHAVESGIEEKYARAYFDSEEGKAQRDKKHREATDRAKRKEQIFHAHSGAYRTGFGEVPKKATPAAKGFLGKLFGWLNS